MADLHRLPPGTLPPVVLGMDASTQPVCLVTLKGQGLNETSLKDLAQFQVRNQISSVQGASVPQPYGGTYCSSARSSFSRSGCGEQANVSKTAH
jgi:multidrug efflux pump subunit AcrB